MMKKIILTAMVSAVFGVSCMASAAVAHTNGISLVQSVSNDDSCKEAWQWLNPLCWVRDGFGG